MAVTEKQVKTLDEQFHEVSVAIAESHDFTGFCFTRLDQKIVRLDGRVGAVEARLGAVETRLGTVETGLCSLASKVDNLKVEVSSVDAKVDKLAVTMDRRFTRQELLLTELLNEFKARPRA